jgi:hypothetical protein
VLLLALLALSGCAAEPATMTVPQAVAAVLADRPGAADALRAAASRDWPACARAIADLANHDDPRVRAAAVTVIAEHANDALLALIVPRAMDADWRVRAAAVATLAARGGPGDPPTLRDTPLEIREAWLAAWIKDHDERADPDLYPEICELVAGQKHLEFGRAMVDRCLDCHAGERPEPPAASEACARCHPDAGRTWAESAHAQTLSHLALVTVDAATREARPWDFGPLRGIGCAECHRVARANPLVDPAAERAGECPWIFSETEADEDSCARCHAAVQAQFEAWRAGPQPRREPFPPGRINLKARGDERDCVGCHMPADREGPPPHDWSARRDPAMLREGIDVAAVRDAGAAAQEGVRFTLTNLAGHATPAGTRRRGLQLWAGPEGGEMRLVAAMSPVRAGGALAESSPALGPAQQRTVFVEAPAGASAIEWRLVYVRDVFEPARWSVDVTSGRVPLGPWAGE